MNGGVHVFQTVSSLSPSFWQSGLILSPRMINILFCWVKGDETEVAQGLYENGVFIFWVNFTFKLEEHKFLPMENKTFVSWLSGKTTYKSLKTRTICYSWGRNGIKYCQGKGYSYPTNLLIGQVTFCGTVYLQLIVMPLLNLQKAISTLHEKFFWENYEKSNSLDMSHFMDINFTLLLL